MGFWQRADRPAAASDKRICALNFSLRNTKWRAWTRMVLSSTELPHLAGKQIRRRLDPGTRQHRRQANAIFQLRRHFWCGPSPQCSRAGQIHLPLWGSLTVIGSGHRHRSGYRVEGQGTLLPLPEGGNRAGLAGFAPPAFVVGVGASIPRPSAQYLSFQLFERKHPYFLCFFHVCSFQG